MPSGDAIDAKIAHIQEQIDQLKKNEKVVQRIGGATTTDLGNEIDFQKSRLDELTWAQGQDDAAIQGRIDNYESQLQGGPYEYGNVILRGLPPSEIQLIAKVEVLMIALGTHPGQVG